MFVIVAMHYSQLKKNTRLLSTTFTVIRTLRRLARDYKIELARGRSTQECFQGLCEVCGDAALSYRTVARWDKSVREGRNANQDNLHKRRPHVENITD